MDATAPPSLRIPKSESLRVMSPLAQLGHATLAAAPGTYFSKSALQARQRYS
jgi:hypothetical protein